VPSKQRVGQVERGQFIRANVLAAGHHLLDKQADGKMNSARAQPASSILLAALQERLRRQPPKPLDRLGLMDLAATAPSA
jgi:hypothetical protein